MNSAARPWRPRNASALLALLFLALLLPACHGRGRTLVVVTVAGLRSDALTPEAAPFITGREAAGRALAPQPHPLPGLAALMTGERAEMLGIRYADMVRIPRGTRTTAERLHEDGWRTAAFVGQDDVLPTTGLRRGFATWVGPQDVSDRAVTGQELGRVEGASRLAASALVDRAGTWLRNNPGRHSAFLWLHMGEPVNAVAAAEGDPSAAYRQAVRRVDDAVRDLAETLATFGRGDATIVLVSVHGLALGAQGEVLHGLTLAPDVVEVPVVLPEALPGDTVGLHEVGRQIARLAGLEFPRDEAPVVSVTRTPQREYGWPIEAVAAAPAGRLVLGAEPAWAPRAGAPLRGSAAWTAAPADLRTALEKAGLAPQPAAPNSRDRVLALMREARQAGAAGDIPRSIALLEQAAGEAPGALAPRVVRLRVESLRERPAPAVIAALAQELAALAGTDPARRIDAAQVLVQVGRSQDALVLLRAIDRPGLSTGERIVLGRALAEAGANDEAIEIATALAAEEPAAPEIQEWTGDLLARTGNAFRARGAYEKALAAPGGASANILAKLGDALASLGEKDAALERYAQAVAADPEYRYPHSRAADILLEKGQVGAAAHATVQSLPPTGDTVSDALLRARVLARRGLLEAAAIELQRGLEKAPADERLLVEMSRVLAQAGAADKSREYLDRALREHPAGAFALVEAARRAALERQPQRALEFLDRAEATAGPGLTRQVREEPAFRAGGEASPVARRAAGFTGRGAGLVPAMDGGNAAPR